MKKRAQARSVLALGAVCLWSLSACSTHSGSSGVPVHGAPEGDTAVDPPRDPDAPFAAGEQINIGNADGVVGTYPVNTELREVLMPGDLDGDGLGELLVVGVRHEPAETVDCSRGCAGFDRAFVDVIHGRRDLGANTDVTPDARWQSWFVNDLRYSVRPAGDLDGDGRSDVLVGIWTAGCEQGSAIVIYGGRTVGESDVRTLGSLVRESGHCTHFGRAEGLGDIDGDGLDDYAIGAPDADDGRGRLHVYYGSRERPQTRRTEANADATLTHSASPRGFGYASALGDVNGDGADDFVVFSRANETDYQFPRDGYHPSEMRLVLGSTTRLTGTIDVSSRGSALDFPFRSAARLGDVNGDGIDDFAVTAATGTARDGFVFHGRSSWPANIRLDLAATSIERSAHTDDTTFVIGAGDTNGDGLRDLLYGDPGFTDNQNWQRGAAYLFRSTATGFPNALTVSQGTGFLGASSVQGDEQGARTPNAAAGRAIAGGSDLNGDGISDIAFARPRSYTARAYIWLGRAQ